MTKKEENPLFVGITNGDELRRIMLGCSKCILESLKNYEKFKDVREEKIKLINEFKSEVKEINKLINMLRAQLPKVKRIEIKKRETKKIKEDNLRMVKVEKPKAKTELERLEEELDDIENKLNSLS